MRNIVILNSLHFSYPLPILMRVSYNTLIVKQNTSDYYKYKHNGVKSVQCGGEIEIFIDIKSATDDVDKNPGKPLFDVFACQHPHSDNAQRRCEAVQPRNVTVCVFDKYPGDTDERHDKHKE